MWNDWTAEVRVLAVVIALVIGLAGSSESEGPESGEGVPEGMASVPSGSCEMGDHSRDPIHDKLNKFALPVHTVDIDAFCMGIYEVTNGKYAEYLNSVYSQELVEVSDNVVHKAGGDYIHHLFVLLLDAQAGCSRKAGYNPAARS